MKGIKASKRGMTPLVIVGPSGVGKSVLIGRLMKKYPKSFGFSVSHTTRGPRAGEEDGRDYHFSNRDAMEMMVKKGEFVEYAEVHGNLYGTSLASVKAVQAEGKVCILDIDVQGARSVKASGLMPMAVFIAPPSLEILEARLRGRGTETEEAIQKRLGNAESEIEASKDAGLFDSIIVNDDLENAFKQLETIAFKCAGKKLKGPQDVDPDALTRFEQEKVVKIQSVARGKRDRARVERIKEEKELKVGLLYTPVLTGPQEQENAAIKIQSRARGMRDRGRVRKIKGDSEEGDPAE